MSVYLLQRFVEECFISVRSFIFDSFSTKNVITTNVRCLLLEMYLFFQLHIYKCHMQIFTQIHQEESYFEVC